ncbi:MAG TPA: head GIN domain-containing protein [Pyrinomonadaceae bacterium]|nr:head GIN domain-containing protein [Pyrinomonadaceae bacterium]
MKKLLLILVLCSLVAGCHYNVKMHGTTGSGIRKVEKRELNPFTSISTDGAFEIEVVCQQSQSVEVEGDDNLLQMVSTEVSNGVLRINNRGNYSARTPMKIKISVPNIEGLTANGAGTVAVTRLKNEKFDLNSNGAPTIRLSGETKELQIDANGAGVVDAHKLRASRAEVESRGVAKVEVFASDLLNVTVSGPSSVIYDGDPSVNQTINGPGSVQKRDTGGA